jgi:orotate phosphoribosyltransferase
MTNRAGVARSPRIVTVEIVRPTYITARNLPAGRVEAHGVAHGGQGRDGPDEKIGSYKYTSPTGRSMRSIDALIETAGTLTEQGLSQGAIADELNVSRDTASWLVAQSEGESSAAGSEESPVDVHVDWSAIGRDSSRLRHLGAIMADLLAGEDEDVDLTVGVGKSGAPLATVIGQELGSDISVYMPSKYGWNEGEDDGETGSFSQNFAAIRDRDCYVVDDNIDTGQTMRETVSRIRDAGGTPRAGVVLTDKLGADEIAGVPVYALVKVVQMATE